MREIKKEAYAKINLGLDVLRKREDGYHEVRMIMQTVRLCDQVRVCVKEKKGISGKSNLKKLPVNENNLVYKAAKLLMDEFGIDKGISVKLIKKIPTAAGLAGGSSDAAAVLEVVNQIFCLGLTKEELMNRAVVIGADVPYCILRGTALAEGIGEKLTSLPPVPNYYVLLVKPDIDVSTKFVYTNLKADELKHHPDIDGQIHALEQKDFKTLILKMENVLESVTVKEYPVIDQIKQKLIRLGALNAMMSGSGPTVFGVFEEEEKANYAYQKMKTGRWGKQIFLTQMV